MDEKRKKSRYFAPLNEFNTGRDGGFRAEAFYAQTNHAITIRSHIFKKRKERAIQ